MNKRRRRRRAHRSRARRSGALRILTGLLAAGYLGLAVFVGVAISKRWLLPLAQSGLESQAEAETDTETETDDRRLVEALNQEEAQAQERTVTPPGLAAFAVGAGPYEDLEKANESALLLQGRGGAGYIFRQDEDEGYLVLLSVYDGEEAARTVAARLAEAGRLQTQVVDLSAEGAALTIACGEERARAIEESYTEFTNALAELDKTWRALDRGEMQAADAAAKASALEQGLERARTAAFDGALIEGEAQALSGWEDCLTNCAGYLQTISFSEQSAMAISAKIKYTHIACIAQYRNYAKGLLA